MNVLIASLISIFVFFSDVAIDKKAHFGAGFNNSAILNEIGITDPRHKLAIAFGAEVAFEIMLSDGNGVDMAYQLFGILAECILSKESEATNELQRVRKDSLSGNERGI